MIRTTTGTPEITAPGKLMLGGTSMAWGAELWSWLGTNEPQITSIAAVLGATVAIAGFLISLFKKEDK